MKTKIWDYQPPYKRTQGLRTRLRRMVWLPKREGDVAVLKSGSKYRMAKDGWRRLMAIIAAVLVAGVARAETWNLSGTNNVIWRAVQALQSGNTNATVLTLGPVPSNIQTIVDKLIPIPEIALTEAVTSEYDSAIDWGPYYTTNYSLFATNGCTLMDALVWTAIEIGPVTISVTNGAVTIAEGLTMDEASRQFWVELADCYPGVFPAHTTNAIRELAEDGVICAVIGHVWQHHFIMGKSDVRKCGVCGRIQMGRKVWE